MRWKAGTLPFLAGATIVAVVSLFSWPAAAQALSLTFYDSPTTWPEAECFCKEQGGHLASISSPDDIAAIAAVAPTGRFWIGGHEVSLSADLTGSPRSFAWTDQVAFNASIIPWGMDQPDNAAGTVHERGISAQLQSGVQLAAFDDDTTLHLPFHEYKHQHNQQHQYKHEYVYVHFNLDLHKHQHKHQHEYIHFNLDLHKHEYVYVHVDLHLYVDVHNQQHQHKHKHDSTSTSTSTSTSSSHEPCLTSVDADIVLVLDSSIAIGSDGWQDLQQFARRYVENIDIALDRMRVAMVSFSDTSTTVFDFDDHGDVGSMKAAITAAPYHNSGPSAVASALQAIIPSLLENPAAGRRLSVPSVVIVVTTETSEPEALLQSTAASVAGTGAQVYVIGVGAFDPLRNTVDDLSTLNAWAREFATTEPVARWSTATLAVIQTVCDRFDG
ncbi:hypothetical protein PTSG_11996 [Salpingoeca rosetta]|uniref:VWFA domain-containing protein n=1 Tax=Salpingoeca rosetta (strain ATCC 50818 / BSB-021) TaxID=946362 RepID=F2U4V0_SALR5|nr:uncharacterized protein PTSG_11996 [Salpingoeca rosetta]EGD82666.1 hypothetical protein PTSG_11996 [Salpingoeca rosetta]|eukprot:XP_004995902.1 hypothetical protein PTSG_11996 [Salpingoeca rosetta]